MLSRQDKSAFLHKIGIIQQAQGDLVAAKASFEGTVRLSTTVDMRNLALAQVALKLGDYGVALEQYDPAELRRGIGYLPQSPDLFTGTLRENLTVGNRHATDEDIKVALYYAAMDEFLATAPEGLDLFLGEQGRRLSGGQRQGVALARLLLRKPKTLFLDEPTNAMDQRMQGQIIHRLAELNKLGTGMIICTHRQSLAAMAERLIVMDQGRAVLDGRRDAVLEKLRAMGSAQTSDGKGQR